MDSIEVRAIKFAERWYKKFGSDHEQKAFAIMKKWNQLKDDMYKGRLIPEFGIPDSDNLCRAGAGIEIGQKAALFIAEGKQEEADELINACLVLLAQAERKAKLQNYL